MKKIFYFFIPLFFILSCAPERPQGEARISGNFNAASESKAWLEEINVDRLQVIDSTMLDKKGAFEFKFLPDERGFYRLSIRGYEPILLTVDLSDKLNIVIDTAGKSLNYTVEGNLGSQILQAYHQKTNVTRQTIDSLYAIVLASRSLANFDTIKAGIDNTLIQLMAGHQAAAENLIRNNPDRLSSLLLINQSFAGRALFDINKDSYLFVMIDNALMQNIPGNSHVKSHHARLEDFLHQTATREKAAQRLSIGKKIPDLNLADAEGKNHRLSELDARLSVLLFWASYSPESRADIQQVKALYQQYHKRGLAVYAVSLDHQARFWKAALEIEDLPWINVSDFSGIEGPVAQLYQVPAKLPYYFLLDKQGIIIEKTNDFSTLKKQVADAFGKGE
jgi:peroxiredoxin